MQFNHTSVLLSETIENLAIKTNGIYVDCTLGGGGHSMAIAACLSEQGRLIAIDQDPDAIEAGRTRLANCICKVDIVRANFSQLHQVLDELGVGLVDGILLDLGVSSYQLDVAERGFSYMNDGPLDMRMDPANKISAFQIVNTYSECELTDIFYKYGEEKWAKRIAAFIAEKRTVAKISTTGELVEIIKQAIPAAARRSGPHPAKRTFQAIRIEVNGELKILEQVVVAGVERLNTDGKLCIITFHSLEDRIIKKTMRYLSTGCICPPQLPICVCNHKPVIKAIKPISPTEIEVEANPRSRSAKLRIANKLKG